MSEESSPPARRAAGGSEGDDGTVWSAANPKGEAEPTTPVPPPPVLPTPRAPLPVGRRFSADDLPEDYQPPLPRRSASSPSEYAPRSPLTPAATAAPAPDAAGATAAPAGRRRRPWLWGLLVLALAAAIVAGWLLTRGQPVAPAPSPTPSTTPTIALADLLAGPEALSPLGGTWQAGPALTGLDDANPQPRCLTAPSTQPLAPVGMAVRTFEGGGPAASAVLHHLESYLDGDEAERAYDARLSQLGGCSGGGARVLGGLELTELGDAAGGVRVVTTDGSDQYHDVVLARSGNTLSILDVARAGEAPDHADVARTAAAALAKACSAAQGACGGTASAKETAPPAGEPAGWLAIGDLPQVNDGVGAWNGLAIPQLRLPGSQCETFDLEDPADADTKAQRTYLLTDDQAAPQGFGIDEAVYTFDDEKAARAFAEGLASQLDKCPGRTNTAKVKRIVSLDKSAWGVGYTVRQQLGGRQTTTYTVGVVRSGESVAYLLANPSNDFGFDDRAWEDILTRAQQRLEQLP